MNPLIVVPTFISSRTKRPDSNPLTVYDHTTPLSAPGELPRLIASLSRVRDCGLVAILVSADPAIEPQAVEKVREACRHASAVSTVVVSSKEVSLLRRRFEQRGLGRLETEIGLSGYGAIRNLGLVLAGLLGFDAVVFLDDDEVIDDPDFLIKGMYGLGKLTPRGVPILAKSGYYLNDEGTFHSQSQDRWYNRFWQQGRAFNQWIDAAMRGPRLSRSNHVCGGCLALHREAFRRLSFDPWIARGEDLDYMLNLRMYGSDIWFDNQWMLRHLPPRTRSEGLRFRQDIYRWLYEYRKMEYSRTQIDLHQVKPASLEPYPGPFLEPGIERRVRLTAILRSIGRTDRSQYLRAARTARREAAVYAERNCAKYFEFQFVWPELMKAVEADEELREAVVQSLLNRPYRPEPLAPSIDPGATSEIQLNLSDYLP